MTRNSLDDLFISNQLLNSYIDFLDTRIKIELDILKSTYNKMPIDKLSSESIRYIELDIKHRKKSLESFQNSLYQIKYKIAEAFKKYPIRPSIFSKDQYKNNLIDHQEKIMQLLQELTEYG